MTATITTDDLRRLGFREGKSGVNWSLGHRLTVSIYRDGPVDVIVGDEPFYGVRTADDLETLIRLLGEKM